MAVKNAYIWDVMPSDSCNNRRFGGAYRLHHLRRVLRLLVTANVGPSPPILVILMMEAICSSEMLLLTTATWHIIPKDGFFVVTALKTSKFT
jgi:hypothetical protein